MQPEKDWTVLVYQEGRDGLAYSAKNSLQELAQHGSGDHVNVIVQQTLAPVLRERLLPGMESSPTRRYVIGAQTGSQVVQEFAGRESLTQQSLSDFLRWGMETYPARHYAVIIKRHGEGYRESAQAPLSASQMQQALQQAREKSGQEIDLIAFDSCTMQQTEVSYQLRDQAQVMVASEANVLAEAFPYAETVEVLKNSPQISPQQLGSQIVQQQAKKFHPTVETAVDLKAQKALGKATQKAVQTLLDEKVSPALIYTNLMSVRPIEANDPSQAAFDFRDLPAFLSKLANDPRLTSEKAREALENALKAQQDTLLAHHNGDNHALWGNAKGSTVYLPWQGPAPKVQQEYQQLDWARDTGWDRLLNYVFDTPAADLPAPESQVGDARSLSQKVGGMALRAYKKYISGYLGVACGYTPSCSQYTRDAIMHYGLLEGSKYGAMRWISCDGHHGGHHPVPGVPHDHDQAHEHQEPVSLVSPPTSRPSAGRRMVTHAAARCAQLAGQVVGAVGGALLGAPLGLVLGGLVGHKVGNGSIDNWNQQLFEKYQPHAPEKIVDMELKLGSSAFQLRNALLEGTGSELWSGRLAGAYGAISGALLGAVGGALALGRMGSKFSGLAASNATRDLLGQLPTDPYTQDLLHKEFT